MSSAKSARPRTPRRAAERIDQKLAEGRDKLFFLEAGGSPEKPIAVGSASLVELRARAIACPRCLGELRVEDHTAETFHGVLQRVVQMKCYHCGGRRRVFVRVGPGLAS